MVKLAGSIYIFCFVPRIVPQITWLPGYYADTFPSRQFAGCVVSKVPGDLLHCKLHCIGGR